MTKLKAQKGNRGTKSGQLTTADLIVLSLLAERTMNGYEMIGEYDRQEVADWASVSKAQVYYAIQKLIDLKMIARAKQGAKEGKKDRVTYAPTKLGRQQLAKSLVTPDWASARVAQPFATWLGLSIHLKTKETAHMMKARKIFLAQEIERESNSLAFIKTLSSKRAKAGEAIVCLVIKQLEAELEWIEELLRK